MDWRHFVIYLLNDPHIVLLREDWLSSSGHLCYCNQPCYITIRFHVPCHTCSLLNCFWAGSRPMSC